MSNSMSGNPIIMDTATANWAANGLPGNGLISVYKIIWLNPTAVGDSFTIKEADGSTKFTALAESATATPGNSQMFTFTKPLQLSKTRGWYLSSISSGTIYLYF